MPLARTISCVPDSTACAAKVIAKKTGQSARTIHSLIYDYSDMTEQTEDGEDGSATFKMIG